MEKIAKIVVIRIRSVLFDKISLQKEEIASDRGGPTTVLKCSRLWKLRTELMTFAMYRYAFIDSFLFFGNFCDSYYIVGAFAAFPCEPALLSAAMKNNTELVVPSVYPRRLLS